MQRDWPRNSWHPPECERQVGDKTLPDKPVCILTFRLRFPSWSLTTCRWVTHLPPLIAPLSHSSDWHFLRVYNFLCRKQILFPPHSGSIRRNTITGDTYGSKQNLQTSKYLVYGLRPSSSVPQPSQRHRKRISGPEIKDSHFVASNWIADSPPSFHLTNETQPCVISGIHRAVNEIFVLLRCYSA